MRLVAAMLAAALALSACVSSEQLEPGKKPADAAAINVQLAIAYMRLDKLSIARKFIERALRQDADDASVQETAGIVYERIGDTEKARHAYSEAARIGKDDPDILNTYAGYLCRTQRAAEGEKLFERVIRSPLYQTPEVAMVNAGVCLEGSGDYIGADRYFNRALAQHPNMPQALLESGALALERKDPQQAADTVRRYLAVNPPSAEIFWLGLRAERALGNENEAAAYGQRLQKDFPASNEARTMRAGIAR